MITVAPERWTYFSGRVENGPIGTLTEDIVKLQDKDPTAPIRLFISSGGGDSLVGFGFYEFLCYVIKPQLQTVALGEIGSIAVLMYMAGAKRLITKNSTVYLHEFGLSFSDKSTWSLSNAKTKLADMTVDQNKYVSIIARRSDGNLERRILLTMMKNNTTLTAKQAVKLGIAHEVLE